MMEVHDTPVMIMMMMIQPCTNIILNAAGTVTYTEDNSCVNKLISRINTGQPQTTALIIQTFIACTQLNVTDDL